MLIGNLGKDPEIRTTQSGTRCANLSVATSETWKDRNSGEKREKTEWHRVTVWNEKLVDVIEKYAKKGQKVFVEGQIQTRKWQDQAGTDRYSTEIVLPAYGGTFTMLSDSRQGGGSDEDENQDRGYSSSGREHGAVNQGGTGYGSGGADLDDDIPFAPSFF
jgi:single-strand DNA-binding protein